MKGRELILMNIQFKMDIRRINSLTPNSLLLILNSYEWNLSVLNRKSAYFMMIPFIFTLYEEFFDFIDYKHKILI